MSTSLLIVASGYSHSLAAAEFLATQPSWRGIPFIHPDVWQFNPDPVNLAIEQVRDILTQIPYAPYQHTRRCLVIYHLDLASPAAITALLKSTEEPPDYLDWLLTATSLATIPATIISRCHLVWWPASTADHSDHLSAATTFDLSQVTHFYQRLLAADTGQAVVLASEFADRASALALVDQLLWWLSSPPNSHQSPLTEFDPAQIYHHRQIWQTAHTHLSHNVNVLLALENAFFAVLGASKM